MRVGNLLYKIIHHTDFTAVGAIETHFFPYLYHLCAYVFMFSVHGGISKYLRMKLRQINEESDTRFSHHLAPFEGLLSLL